MNNITRFLDGITHDQLILRLDLALGGASLGIWDWDLRDNSVQFDQRWCEMLGLDHASTPMHLATWSDRVHPDDLAQCYADVNAHLEGRTKFYENVHRMRHANGEWRYILDRGRISGRDADGRPIRFTGTHFDLTSRELDRQRITNHERELADLVAAMPTAIAVFDRELRYIAASDAWLREFGIDQPRAGSPLDVPDQALWMARMRRALDGEESREDEEPVPVSAGCPPRWRSFVVLPWRRGGEEVVGALVRVDDVTEAVKLRRSRERQRESRMQMLAMFAGGVAHEINSPLQVIGIESHLIATALDGDDASIDELRKSARMIREMATRAMSITRALRTLSRDPHGDPVESVPAASVCEQACVLVQARFKAAGVQLTQSEIAPGLCALTRPSELIHVLVNLLDNAHVAAAKGDPWVRLEVVAEAKDVVFRCVDGGVGVAPHLQPLLGEPFVTDKPSGQGTGLGLSIVKVLAERSGGALRFVADADHTTFEVRFPLAKGVQG